MTIIKLPETDTDHVRYVVLENVAAVNRNSDDETVVWLSGGGTIVLDGKQAEVLAEALEWRLAAICPLS